MATSEGPVPAPDARGRNLAKVIIIGSVMFTFISYWRTAAVVLCDLASTAYYIGGIVEQAIGPAAPFFILAVMLFSYAVRSVYIESCSLFVRGGAYKVVKAAMGGFLAKLSVSALMFDYILTGPTSGVSAGQYIIGLLLDALTLINPEFKAGIEASKDSIKRWGSVTIACAITVYFYRQNLFGIHESSDKALKIMVLTTIMAVIMLTWAIITLAIRGGPVNPVVWQPDLERKVKFELASRYQVSERAFDELIDEGVPDNISGKLASIKGIEFRSAREFHERLMGVLTTNELAKYQQTIDKHAKIVERYELSESALDSLKNKVPDEILEKLRALREKPSSTAKEFDRQLSAVLQPEEMNQYAELIRNAAEVVEGIDRITGEQKPMWAQDDRTGALIPARDKTGNPDPKINEVTGKQEDPLGFLGRFPSLDKLRHPASWLSFIGVIGLLLAFGHSILAMSGEETLAQVYREIESPKLPNFKKAAFIVFVYSVLLTVSISFLAVMLIPNEVRMKDYSENLIGGLAMYVIGPLVARLILSAFVVFVGFLILAGAVNTAILGSNGVLNRVAEDGVLPDWFLKPHPRYGTTSRLLKLIVILQLFIILVSRGDMFVLGEAYAFGVVWSFVFTAMAMVVLRFKDRSPREFKVPLNVRIGDVEFPIGLCLIFIILLITAVLNFLTKEVATVGGLAFTGAFLITFIVSEHFHEKRLKGVHHKHLEQFNQQTADVITPSSLGLAKIYRKLVAIRSPQNLYMLEKALAETDPETTDMVVMTAKVAPAGDTSIAGHDLDTYDQSLMTAVVDRAEKAGKEVKPVIVPTNNPLFAIIRTAKELQAQELVMGASNKYTADEQLEQIGFYWINMHDGAPGPLTVRILGRDRDVHLDLAGGNRIPKISERKARTVADLRAAGVGVDRVLMVHAGSSASSDLFQAVLTMLDPNVVLTLLHVKANGQAPQNGKDTLHEDQERAEKLGREVELQSALGEPGVEVVRLAREGRYDLVIVGMPDESATDEPEMLEDQVKYILHHSPCRVFVASAPAIPQEPEETAPSPAPARK